MCVGVKRVLSRTPMERVSHGDKGDSLVKI